MIIPDNTNIGTASNGKLSIPPSIERMTNVPLAVNDGSNAPGSTDNDPKGDRNRNCNDQTNKEE